MKKSRQMKGQQFFSFPGYEKSFALQMFCNIQNSCVANYSRKDVLDQTENVVISMDLVPRRGVEPLISGMRTQCPGPLDERGKPTNYTNPGSCLTIIVC